MEQRWIPVSERLPDADKYILVSIENFIISDIGRYETDKDGSGAFYPGDDGKSYVEYGLFVNAWMPLPEPYRESEDNMERLTYVAENGEVLFHPADLPDDEGITITQLAKDGRYKALEEIQQYREIGTPEECRAAVEKQTAKKVVSFEYHNGTINYGCPVCKWKIISKINGEWCVGTFNEYCDRCGQKLDWSDEDEKI